MKAVFIFFNFMFFFYIKLDAQQYDFSASIHQESINKLLNTISNQDWKNFTVVEVNKPFNGFDKKLKNNKISEETEYVNRFLFFKKPVISLNQNDNSDLLRHYFEIKQLQALQNTLDNDDLELVNGIDKVMNEIVSEGNDDKKNIDKAIQNGEIDGDVAFGMKSEIDKIISWATIGDGEDQALKDARILGLSNYIQFKVHLARFRVKTDEKPTVIIGMNELTINGKISGGFKTELWYRRRHFKCRIFPPSCTWGDWKRPKRIASLSLKDGSIKATFAIESQLAEEKNTLVAKLRFKSLRLNHAIVKYIPLENFANKELNKSDKGKFLLYDANKFMVSVPKFNSKFVIKEFSLVPLPAELRINLIIKQL